MFHVRQFDFVDTEILINNEDNSTNSLGEITIHSWTACQKPLFWYKRCLKHVFP